MGSVYKHNSTAPKDDTDTDTDDVGIWRTIIKWHSTMPKTYTDTAICMDVESSETHRHANNRLFQDDECHLQDTVFLHSKDQNAFDTVMTHRSE